MSAKNATPEEVEDPEGPEDDKPMSFWDHLDELRKRVTTSLIVLLVATLVAWQFAEELFKIASKPFCDAWVEQKLEGTCELNFAAPQDGFTAYFNLSLIVGVMASAPVIFYQVWSFIAPGLYAKEKRYVIPFVAMSTLLFGCGMWFGFAVAFPFTFGYFLSFAGNIGEAVKISPEVMMGDYFSFVLKVLLGFGLIFEIPVVFSFLAMVGVVTHRKLIRWARYYIFGAFLVAAILTPPDWASQIAMAVPACGLYGLSIGLVYLLQRKDALQAELDDEKAEKEALAEKEREEAEAKKKKR
jgi:sec-independent protein translocase protein TatC